MIRSELDDSHNTLPYGASPKNDRYCPLYRIRGGDAAGRRDARGGHGSAYRPCRSAWGSALDPIRRTRPRRVILDATGVTYCDGADLAFFAQIRRTAAMVGAQVSVAGLEAGSAVPPAPVCAMVVTVVAAAVCTLAASCGMLSQPAREKALFAIDPGEPPTAVTPMASTSKASTTMPGGAVHRVRPLRVASPGRSAGGAARSPAASGPLPA